MERSRRVEVPTKKVYRVRSKNLPSILPGEETFVTQSQQVALSSTLAVRNSQLFGSKINNMVKVILKFISRH